MPPAANMAWIFGLLRTGKTSLRVVYNRSRGSRNQVVVSPKSPSRALNQRPRGQPLIMMPIPELPSPLEWAAAMANGFFREMSVGVSTTLPRACSGDRPMPPAPASIRADPASIGSLRLVVNDGSPRSGTRSRLDIERIHPDP